MKIVLQLKANLENLSFLATDGDDFRWYLKLKCLNCGEISDKWTYACLNERAALKGGRGEAALVIKCKLCSRENSIGSVNSIADIWNLYEKLLRKDIVEALNRANLAHFKSDILKDKLAKYTSEDNSKFSSVVAFECRGLEPVDFSPRVGFVAEAEGSGTVFKDINLEEKEWVDYDEKGRQSVGVYQLEHQFKKL